MAIKERVYMGSRIVYDRSLLHVRTTVSSKFGIPYHRKAYVHLGEVPLSHVYLMTPKETIMHFNQDDKRSAHPGQYYSMVMNSTVAIDRLPLAVRDQALGFVFNPATGYFAISPAKEFIGHEAVSKSFQVVKDAPQILPVKDFSLFRLKGALKIDDEGKVIHFEVIHQMSGVEGSFDDVESTFKKAYLHLCLALKAMGCPDQMQIKDSGSYLFLSSRVGYIGGPTLEEVISDFTPKADV